MRPLPRRCSKCSATTELSTSLWRRGFRVARAPPAGGWSELDAGDHIADAALEAPLPISAAIHAAKADDAVARALIARHNPVIEAVKAESKVEGKIESLLVLLAARDIALDVVARDRIAGERDPRQLDRWTARAATAASILDVLGDD